MNSLNFDKINIYNQIKFIKSTLKILSFAITSFFSKKWKNNTENNNKMVDVKTSKSTKLFFKLCNLEDMASMMIIKI